MIKFPVVAHKVIGFLNKWRKTARKEEVQKLEELLRMLTEGLAMVTSIKLSVIHSFIFFVCKWNGCVKLEDIYSNIRCCVFADILEREYVSVMQFLELIFISWQPQRILFLDFNRSAARVIGLKESCDIILCQNIFYEINVMSNYY